MHSFSATRLRTWAVEIAQTLLGDSGVNRGHDRRFKDRGGFVVDRRDGKWFCHAEDRGGQSAIAMIAFLRGCSSQDAEQWGAAWLREHAGDGSCTAGVDATEEFDERAARTAANNATAHAVLEASVPLTDPRAAPAVVHLRSRALEPPYPENLRYLPGRLAGATAPGRGRRACRRTPRPRRGARRTADLVDPARCQEPARAGARNFPVCGPPCEGRNVLPAGAERRSLALEENAGARRLRGCRGCVELRRGRGGAADRGHAGCRPVEAHRSAPR
jgi:hypothetical protein